MTLRAAATTTATTSTVIQRSGVATKNRKKLTALKGEEVEHVVLLRALLLLAL